MNNNNTFLNFVNYFKCYSRLRFFQIRHRKTILVIALLLFTISIFWESIHFNSTEWSTGGKFKSLRLYQDEMLLLQAHIGYLRKKLANAGVNVNLNDPDIPTIYVITPTYGRPEQLAELTRLCHTFLLVPNLHWILVEDAKIPTTLVTNFLNNCGVSYTQLYVLTPEQAKLKDMDPHWSKPRGVIQRNEGIQYLRNLFAKNNQEDLKGVVYFGDDDNTYSLELFSTMRDTKTVSVWPVALVGGLLVEKPRVDNGKVVGWDVAWSPYRAFATDMAGFAVNVQLLLRKPRAKFSYRVKIGQLESEFIKHLIPDISHLEPKSHKKIQVWHTRAKKANLEQEVKLKINLLPPSDANFVM